MDKSGEIPVETNEATEKLLSMKSRDVYIQVYVAFEHWMRDKCVNNITEIVVFVLPWYNPTMPV